MLLLLGRGVIVIRIELHSAITRKVTTLGVMHIANDGTGTDETRNYNGTVFRKPDFVFENKRGRVEGHRAKDEVIWVLLAKMLHSLGYMKGISKRGR